jgi:Protein of unknown function (DUF2795)
MTGDVFIPSAVNDKDFALLLESVSFPLTKAEIIRKAEANRVPPTLLGLLHKLPSRFYHSKDEFIGQCIVRSIRYSEIGFNIRPIYETKV